jgi:hypothetical protein
MLSSQPVRFDAPSCTLTMTMPRPGVILLVLTGRDSGELGVAPFRELEARISEGQSWELFIDARAATGATLDVSGSWAVWLGANKQRFGQVSMLTGSPFIQMTAGVVKNFAALGEKMRLYTDRDAFESALNGEALAED